MTNMTRAAAITAALALFLPVLAHAADPKPLPAQCRTEPLPAGAWGEAYAIDGDTLAVTGLVPHLRIWGIQAAELRDKPAPGATGIETVAGMAGRGAMEDMLTAAARKIHYEPTKWDRYCRIVAHVTVMAPKLGEPEIDLGLTMLERGAAYGFWLDDAIPGKPDLSKAYADAEAAARKEKRGLWPQWLHEK